MVVATTVTKQLSGTHFSAIWKLDPMDGSDDLAKDGHLNFLCTITHRLRTSANTWARCWIPRMGLTSPAFTIDGETFQAHRAVLAARSPVFRAELFGSMAESKMPSINLQDIAPATFKAMLGYMYTDVLPRDDKLGGGSSREMFERLLAAADPYALDRLKLLCAQNMWDNVSVDTVASVLRCAEMYSCPELKSKCIDFFAQEKNFKKAVLTEGFVTLV
ncbi:hypothetical protein U9M48_041219 [Paspalum notatum var. saurae]|uniref:BTB domain-containing protein n=1 Tax=Paspalum notatum var. saurae TaxID=547442 RepID=A0AAQ3XF14_PASNO